MAVEAQNKARKLGITCPDTLWEVSSLRSAYLVLRPTMGPGLGPYFRVDLPEKTRKNMRLTRNRLAKAVGGLGG